MKNSVADRSNAQSSCAAQFIGNNIEVYTTHILTLLPAYYSKGHNYDSLIMSRSF